MTARRKIREDKKYAVKIWIVRHQKLLFRRHCFEAHLAMSETGELFFKKLLDKFDDTQLLGTIEKRYPKFRFAGIESHDHITVRVPEKYWQRFANLAVVYDLSIAKIATCLFDLCIERYDLIGTGWFWYLDE